MANGFIRHKKIQWVFNTVEELKQFKPQIEGVYALDNSRGDIYIWNGLQWLLYYQGAVKVQNQRRSIPDRYRRIDNYIPAFLSTTTQMFHCDVDIYPGNIEIIKPKTHSFYATPHFAEVGNMVFLSGSLELSGSFYTEVSMSIA